MKYIKQPKRHIVLDDFEWRALVKGINEYRKQVIDEDGFVEVVNELLIKIIDAPTKKIKVVEVSKLRTVGSDKSVSGGAGLRWRPLPKAEAPTEPAGETRNTTGT